MKTAPFSVTKTTLTFCILLAGFVASAQVRPPSNAAADVAQVTALLDDLADGQPEAAYARLTDDFRYHGPTFGPATGTYDLLTEWEARQRRFTHQRVTVEKTSTHAVPAGPRQGTWVYLEGNWSAREGDLPTLISFRLWAKLRDGKLAELHLARETDLVFSKFAAALSSRGNRP